MEIDKIILKAREMGVSDIHISEGLPMTFRICGKLTQSPLQMSGGETRATILSMLRKKQEERLNSGEDIDFADPDVRREPSACQCILSAGEGGSYNPSPR